MGEVRSGTRHGGKLTLRNVHKIFLLYRRGITQRELATKFCVSQLSIRNVLRGRTWRIANERIISLDESWNHRCLNIKRSHKLFPKQYPPVEERFWKKVRKSTGCWIWTGAKNKQGYGNFWDGKHFYRATHFAWKLIRGRLPKQAMLLHHCDTPSCVNLQHLYLGNRSDNMRDYISRHGLSVWGRAKY